MTTSQQGLWIRYCNDPDAVVLGDDGRFTLVAREVMKAGKREIDRSALPYDADTDGGLRQVEVSDRISCKAGLTRSPWKGRPTRRAASA